jgi:hypothetical protein
MNIRPNVVIAACYMAYTCVAAAILLVLALVGSQGVSGNISMSLIFAIVVMSPVPMLLVGMTFFRRWRWAPGLAVALALSQLLATMTQLQMAEGTSIGKLSASAATLFYVCYAQTFYLPGSFFFAVISPLLLRFAKTTPDGK